jgi:signal peptide peptidase SppA
MEHTFWAGTDESFATVLEARESVKALAAAAIQAGSSDMPDVAQTYSKDGALGIVPVAGSLIPGNAGWMSMFGITGYQDIIDGLVALAFDPEIKSIFMPVSSGGGSVNGVQQVADLVAQIAKAKPVYAHIDPTGGSAAYWLIAGATQISMDPMGQAGSIGAVMVHRSRTRMMSDAGIDTTMIRSGDSKMICGPDEPLSELAKSEYQSKVDDLASMFLASAAKMRGTTASEMADKAGKGRVFLGKKAVAAGLVDKIQTAAQAMAQARKLK